MGHLQKNLDPSQLYTQKKIVYFGLEMLKRMNRDTQGEAGKK